MGRLGTYGTMVAAVFVSTQMRFYYSPSLNIILLLSSLVALFQPNARLPLFPVKCR